MRYRCPTTSADDKEKRCPCCRLTKPRDEFFTMHKKGGKPSVYCKVCSLAKCKTPKVRWQQRKLHSEGRGIRWMITLPFYEQMLTQPCHYCKGPLGQSGGGCDRINNNADYTNDNVVPCCPMCNWVRHDVFTYPEMVQLGKVLEKIRRDRIAAGMPAPTLIGQRHPQRFTKKRNQEHLRPVRQL